MRKLGWIAYGSTGRLRFGDNFPDTAAHPLNVDGSDDEG
jgi:hypothetical protein